MSRTGEPLPMVLPIWEHEWSVYPDVVRVSMENGKVIDYRCEIKQPRPILKGMLDRFTETCVGYRAKRRRRG